MGLFSKKKKDVKQTTFNTTPSEVAYLIELAIEAIDPSQIEYEIEFMYENKTHIIGIDYDRMNAPKKGYFVEYMTVYLDNQKFRTLDQLYSNAFVDHTIFSGIGKELVLDNVYKKALETGDIEYND